MEETLKQEDLREKMIRDRHKGIACIVLSALCFAFINVFIRAAGDLPSLQKVFFRNLIAFFAAWFVMRRKHVAFSGKKSNLLLLVCRSMFGLVGMMGNFYAVDHLVLADASMLNKMSPFFAILFSMLILKESLSFKQVAAVLGAFAGSLLIIKPTGFDIQSPAAAVGLLGGMGAGIAYTFVRILGKRGEAGPFIVCFFSGFSTLMLLPVFILNYHPMTAWQLGSLLMAGVAATGGQFGITAAYCYAPARDISVYDYSQIVFSAILGFFLFGQLPDVYSWMGYGVICAMAVWMFFMERNGGAKARA